MAPSLALDTKTTWDVYTPQAITVTLDQHDSPRINRALASLIEELNTSPAHIPGDPRPITYKLAAS